MCIRDRIGHVGGDPALAGRGRGIARKDEIGGEGHVPAGRPREEGGGQAVGQFGPTQRRREDVSAAATSSYPSSSF
eukprot:3598590-Pyramimonas_sp.AAC.1